MMSIGCGKDGSPPPIPTPMPPPIPPPPTLPPTPPPILQPTAALYPLPPPPRLLLVDPNPAGPATPNTGTMAACCAHPGDLARSPCPSPCPAGDCWSTRWARSSRDSKLNLRWYGKRTSEGWGGESAGFDRGLGGGLGWRFGRTTLALSLSLLFLFRPSLSPRPDRALSLSSPLLPLL